MSRLRTCLEDIQGQFPQLHTLEEAVLDLDDMCKVGGGQGKGGCVKGPGNVL